MGVGDMSEIDRNIEMINRDLLLARLGLRPQEIPNLMARLAELRTQKWAQFSDGLEAEIVLAYGYKPKANPPTCLVPRSCDEWMDSHGNWHWQDPEIGH